MGLKHAIKNKTFRKEMGVSGGRGFWPRLRSPDDWPVNFHVSLVNFVSSFRNGAAALSSIELFLEEWRMNIKISHITTDAGKIYQRFEFETLADIEEYFVEEILGRTDCRSKVIGKVLIWANEERS